MPIPMRQAGRAVSDRAIICAMLDRMEILHLGIHNEPAPYVVPLNFGYTFEEDLVFYFHCAPAGYKLELLAQNPHVFVTASQFISYAQACVKGHRHDYRSVMASGIASRIDPGSDEFRRALVLLLAHNHRRLMPGDEEAARHMQIWKIVCKREDVTAKAEITPHSVEEVPFAPPVGDGSGLDESHILTVEKAEA